MKKKKASLSIPPKAQLPLALAVPLLIAVAGWMLVVGPQRSKIAAVKQQVSDTQAQIVTARAAATHVPKPEPIRVADIFPLLRAMPDRQDMSGIMLQLNTLADAAGITFQQIQPGAVSPGSGYQSQQIELQFQGNFYGLSDFLYRLRNLVSVRGGKLDASGRLFSVKSVQLGQSDQLPFPNISADLTIQAYIYGNAPTPTAPAAPTDSTATGTDTTQTTTTTTDSGASAAGASTGVSG